MILKLLKTLFLPLVLLYGYEIRSWYKNAYPYLEWLKRDLADCESILELGCGSNSPILKIGYGHKTDAVDIWEPYVSMHNERGDYRSCDVGDVLNLPSKYLYPTYDAVVICDVLEHLDKAEVYKAGLFTDLRNIARKKVILFTPNGYVPNDEVDGNPYQAHQSAWYPRDFEEQGYWVIGSTGLRCLMGKASLPKFRPHRFWQLLIILSQPFVYRYPKIAWHSYAVKEVSK